MNLKVLHIVPGMHPKKGGVGGTVRTFATGLSLCSVQNEVLCLDPPDAAFLIHESITISAKGSRDERWYYSSAFFPYLIENIPHFDVIIVHGLWLYHTYALRKAMNYLRGRNLGHREALKKLPKVYLMPHGMLDPYFQKAAGRKLKAIRNWAYWKFIENKMISEADGLLFTCLTEQELARKTFRPYHPKKEIVVGLGTEEPPSYTIEMQKAFYAKCSLMPGSYLLFLSRIHEKKGLDLLILAYKKCFDVNKNIPKLVIAGPDVGSEYGKEMKKLVCESELRGAVLFVGMLEGAAKWGAFYGCEAFVLPSHQENFGIAVVEALACGKPVLISNQVNIWQEISNSGGGFAAPDTIAGTFELIMKWLNLSIKEKHAMGIQARRCYDEFFAISPVIERLVTVLHS